MLPKPYYSRDGITLYCGDSLEVMPTLAADSVDAIVTDPPYGLSKEPDIDEVLTHWLAGDTYSHGRARKGKNHCASGILRRVFAAVCDTDNSVTKLSEQSVSFRISCCPVPVVWPVQLNDQRSSGKQEIDAHGGVVTEGDRLLMDEGDIEAIQSSGGGDFMLRYAESALCCNGVCSCFAQCSPGLFSVLVRLCDNTFCQPNGTPSVVALTGTELRAVLTLDVRSATGTLAPAQCTSDDDAVFEIFHSQVIGARPAASSLSSELQASDISHIGGFTNWAGPFDLLVHDTFLERLKNPILAQGGMMGKSWDSFVPGPEYWRECYRVLKPGGYLLCFASTRTFDLMAIALRLAGFECHPFMAWLNGAGFPKATNLGKMIDKAAGAEREVVGVDQHRAALLKNQMGNYETPGGWSAGNRSADITDPATDAAKQWDGWFYGKQSLKPAIEPILMFQKPFEKGLNGAQNVLRWGTGGINVGACRIAGEPWATKAAESCGPTVMVPTNVSAESRANIMYRDKPERSGNAAGRWPANAIFSHVSPDEHGHGGCVCTGTKRVKGDQRPQQNGTRPGGFGDVGSDNGDGKPSGPLYGDETVSSYICVAGCPCGHSWNTPDLTSCPECGCRKTFWCCPVRELDEQSGESVSSGGSRCVSGGLGKNVYGKYDAEETPLRQVGLGDTGGASRFFQTFPPFQYVAKADSSERRGSSHPTIKPIDLMRYLVRLVCPIGGKVLDPFCGSGTTVEAAREEHCGAIGIDLSAEYCADAVSRLRQGVLNFSE